MCGAEKKKCILIFKKRDYRKIFMILPIAHYFYLWENCFHCNMWIIKYTERTFPDILRLNENELAELIIEFLSLKCANKQKHLPLSRDGLSEGKDDLRYQIYCTRKQRGNYI